MDKESFPEDLSAPSSDSDRDEMKYLDPSEAAGKDNVADLIPLEESVRLGRRLLEEYDEDLRFFERRRKEIDRIYDVAFQGDFIRDFPRPGSFNTRSPAILKACIQFWTYATITLIQEDMLVKAKVNGSDTGEDAKVEAVIGEPVVGKQTGEPIKPGAGMKADKAKRVSEFLTYQLTEESSEWQDGMSKGLLICPLIGGFYKRVRFDAEAQEIHAKLIMPENLVLDRNADSLESSSRASEPFALYEHEIEERIRSGVYVEFDYKKHRGARNGEAMTEGQSDDKLPHQLIAMQCRLDLDADGLAEPYTVVLHEMSNEIVAVQPRYLEEGIKRNDKGEISRFVPSEDLVEYGFLPDPRGGPYPIGLGHLMLRHSSAIDACTNLLLDSAKNRLMGGGFVSSAVRMESGQITFDRFGQWKVINSGAASLSQSVVPNDSPEPSAVLFELLGHLTQQADEIGSCIRLDVSQLPANMPGITALTAVEQGMQQFKAIFKQIYRSLKKEYNIIYKLDELYLSEEKYLAFVDKSGVTKARDFGGKDYDICPAADPESVAGFQRHARATVLAEYKDDPLVDPIKARKYIFGAAGLPEDLIREPSGEPSPVEQSQIEMNQAQTKLALLQIQQVQLDMDVKRANIAPEAAALEAKTAKDRTAAMQQAATALETSAKTETEEQGRSSLLLKRAFDVIQAIVAAAGSGGMAEGAEEPQGQPMPPPMPQGAMPAPNEQGNAMGAEAA